MRRPLTGTTVALTALAVGLALAPTSPAAADHERLPQGRHLKDYTVRSGDTVTGLAVRFHAWTAEIVSHNHLGADGGLRVGDRIEIPVVTKARDEDRDKDGDKDKGGASTSPSPGTPSRDRVRRTITRAANHRDVDPQLALAIAWQESGWQMHHVSSAGAIGAMQVLPGTGRWMEHYAGRDLRLRNLKDNATAGVLLLGVLDDNTRKRRHQVGAYYQGLGALQEHGLYGETKAYVANVLAIKERLEDGRPPA
ncbi:transglycosylase SLT domain-containing protein [Nocardioides sediminis]|uniref:transglycosylase SLT domain-containing protein n=1 Tax=Nocardioides sediminis TaxID=433648 RepID=UPI000D306787|nr:transglycosylase SLT domain-containing protein [Nocardioides sediminis]